MMARKFNLPVVPLHIRARNSALFYLFDRIHPTLRDITLFHEVLNKARQPYRLTILHPHGQGFWWLFVEPPLLVIAVGLFFYFAVVPGLLEDMEEARATSS